MSNLIHLNMKAEPSVVNDASRIVKRTTVHAFSGNTVTVTDPAGKWKRFLTDARGNLWQVNEPNPNGGVDYITYYTYSTLNHLLTVSMTRPNVPADGTNVTQTRTFLYKSDQRLQSVTNPESGTTSYTYNPDGTMATKTDAKNQVISYFYDTMGRLTQVKNGNVILRTLTYDANPDDQGNNYGTYLLGRIARIDYGVGNSAPAAAGNAWTELYSYDQAGGMLKKKLTLGRAELHPGSLEATLTYDDEGRMTSIKYPDFQYDPATATGPTGPTYTYSYDQMGRPLTLTGGAYVSGVTYGPAGELTSINGETRTYNEQKQLTGINVPGLGSITYSFSSTNNNGRITGMTNTITGESVTYAYDSLNRLISASAGGQWGLSFSYDGFGNRLSQNVTAGSAPTIQQSYDMTTNRLQGQYYDANGNMGGVSWDVENRLLQIQGQTAPYSMDFYDYGIDNKRIYKQTYLQSGNPEEVYFYVVGRKIATYTLAYLDITGDGYPAILFTQPKYNVYFGSRLIIANGQNVVLDRLGSVVWDGAPHSYFPYGEERTPTANNKDKFATYFRDASTGLDYADQRYYASVNGRFSSPDPYRASGGANEPRSWNRYTYVHGDPINYHDKRGLFACCNGSEEEDEEDQFDDGTGGYRFYFQPLGSGGGGGWGGGGGGGGGGQQVKATLPKCDDLLISAMTGFLNGKNSPLLAKDPSFISEVMVEAKAVSVDPRLFIAETLESTYGTSIAATTLNNPFGLKGKRGNSRFDSLGDAIISLGQTLDTQVNTYGFTLAQMYSGLGGIEDKKTHKYIRPPAYCQNAGCVAFGQSVGRDLGAMGGDPNNLKYPSGQVGSKQCE